MSKKVAQMIVDENTTILVETTEEETREPSKDMGKAGIMSYLKAYAIEKTQQRFADAMSIISYSSNIILEEMEKIQQKPDAAQIEFGIKITGEGKAMLAAGAIEANYKVTISWKKTP